METNIRNLESREGHSEDNVNDLIKFEYFEVKEELVGDMCADNGTVVKQEPSDSTCEVCFEDNASEFNNIENSKVKEEFLDNILCDSERIVVKQESSNTDQVCSEDDALESKNKDSNGRSSKERKHDNVCQICSRDYPTREILLSHICGSDKHFCTICGKILRSVGLLKSHMLKAHRSYIDRSSRRISNESFTSKNTLEHRRARHRQSKDDPMYVCDICKTSFTFRGNLIRHVQRHGAEKTYRCGVCDVSFYTEYRLTDHMLVHTGAREVSCGICDKKFARRRTLAEHVKQHADKTPFKCDLCKKGFLTKWNLKVHTQNVHGVTVVCDVCKKDFAFESDLEKHRLRCSVGTE